MSNKAVKMKVIVRSYQSPLYVIAGLSAGVTTSVTNSLKAIGELKDITFIGAPVAKGGTLYELSTRENAIRTMATTILSNRGKSDLVISPRRVVFLYIDGTGADILLNDVRFFCYSEPIKIGELAEGNPQLLKNIPPVVTQQIAAQIKRLEHGDSILKRIEDEVSAKRKSTHLLLPPENFLISREEKLTSEFAKSVDDILESGNRLVKKRFTKEQLPKYLKGSGNKKIYAFVDSRDLVFPPCKDTELHAPPRELPENAKISSIVNKLNELYRFGIPIVDGFHYDVQRVGANSSVEEEFICFEKGKVKSKSDHVNIYPNDFIRASNLRVQPA